jgi:transcriptional regulator with XRE-family HTH domain
LSKLSKRLKRLRIEAGLNQSQFAKAVGVTRACVARWENGEASSMVVRNALSVCEILNTDLNHLFHGKSKPAPLELDTLQKAIKIVDEVSKGWTSKAKASLAAVIYKMLSEGEAKSNMTLSQINKAQKLSQAA